MNTASDVSVSSLDRASPDPLAAAQPVETFSMSIDGRGAGGRQFLDAAPPCAGQVWAGIPRQYGCSVEPTIFTGVTSGPRIAREGSSDPSRR